MNVPVFNKNTGFDEEKTLSKSDVGLGNVDNTSDANKPVSSATQTALNEKVTGCASSTDNAIVRWDSTTGKLVQSSNVFVGDNGELGINNSSPVFPLDVIPSVNFANGINTIGRFGQNDGKNLYLISDHASLGFNMYYKNGYWVYGHGSDADGSYGYGGILVFHSNIGRFEYRISTVAGDEDSSYPSYVSPLNITKDGYVGIGTTAPLCTLHCSNGIASTGALDGTAYANISITMSMETSGGVIQTWSSKSLHLNPNGNYVYLVSDAIVVTSNALYPATSAGVTLGTASKYWGQALMGGIYTNSNEIEINYAGSGNRHTYIDFHSDDTYTDYALRLIRASSGSNSDSTLAHRGTGNLIVTVSEAGGFYIKTSDSNRFSINSSGYPYLYSLNTTSTTTGYGYLFINTTTGEIRRYTSSERYKKNITDIETDTSKIYQLRPVSFEDNGKAEKDEYGYDIQSLRKEIGLIAEEVNEMLPELVYFDKDGLPEGVHYSNLSVLLLAEIKKINDRLTKLEEKVYGVKKAN